MAKPQLTPGEFAFFVLGLELYPWQLEAVQAVRHRHSRMALVAANGSGKTACVNVVLLLWFLYSFPRGIAMVTSGSWNQLSTQLWPNLELHREKFPHWLWGKERISTPEGGFIQAYSSIQPGRAEGHHESLPDRPVMLMADEAKSVPEGIFQAISRCTPTYLALTSSPGRPEGSFYNAFMAPEQRGVYHTVRATAFDCPHIRPERIALAQTLYGPDYERDPVYRSMILAEFTSGDDACIIPLRLVQQALANKPAPRGGDLYAGVDWAAGGDETVLAIRQGNQLRLHYCARERDTTRAAEQIAGTCRRLGVRQACSWADTCGLGIGIIQACEKMHRWRFRQFNGGLAGDDPAHYQDLNIEAWHYLRRSLERGEVCFPDGLDAASIRQLTDRFLYWNNRGKLRCESKEEMRARGLCSPDRADALAMAWWAGRYMRYADSPPKPPPPCEPKFERAPVIPRDWCI